MPFPLEQVSLTKLTALKTRIVSNYRMLVEMNEKEGFGIRGTFIPVVETISNN